MIKSVVIAIFLFVNFIVLDVALGQKTPMTWYARMHIDSYEARMVRNGKWEARIGVGYLDSSSCKFSRPRVGWNICKLRYTSKYGPGNSYLTVSFTPRGAPSNCGVDYLFNTKTVLYKWPSLNARKHISSKTRTKSNRCTFARNTFVGLYARDSLEKFYVLKLVKRSS